MYIEEIADKIARDSIDALVSAPKPLLPSTIVNVTFQTVENYRKEIIETCITDDNLRSLEKEIHILFVELIQDVDLSII